MITPTGDGGYRRELEFVRWNSGYSVWDCSGIVTHWVEAIEFPEDIGL